jgi:hypothetical protein
MDHTLTEAINELRDATSIGENQKFCGYVEGINKFATTDEEKAFMLGNLFRHKGLSHHLPEHIKDGIIEVIETNNLQAYFHGEMQPELNDMKFFALVLLVLGIVSIAAGIFELINGYYNVGISTRYLLPIVRGGGFWIIVGIVFLLGGFLRYSYESKKRHFNADLFSKNE